MMKISDRNKYLYIIAYALRSAALLTATGTLMQTFLTVIGMSSDKIYLHTSAVGAINVIVILLFARFSDKDVIKRSTLVQLSGSVLFLCYLPLCFKEQATITEFILLIAVGCMQSVTTALHTVCDYKLPYYVFRKDEYGGIMAFCGILYSGVSFGVGAVMTALSVKTDYRTLMLCAFIISFVFSAVGAYLTKKMKNICNNDETAKPVTSVQKYSVISVIKAPVFIKLVPASLLRGFASGMTLIFAVIAAENLGYSEQITTACVSVQSVASLAGCALFGILSKSASLLSWGFLRSRAVQCD